MDECFIEASEAHQQAALERAIAACRKASPERVLRAAGLCHNCGEPVGVGETFCAYVEPGESLPACLVDWRARTARAAAK